MQLGGALEFLNMKRKENRRKNAKALTILLLGCVLFMFISGNYCYAMGMVMQQSGQLDVLPGFFMEITSIMTLIMSVLKAKGILFGFKDYDILMSLPVKTSYIVVSRLLQLYIINMVFVIGIMSPCYVVYGILAKPSIEFYLLGFFALLLIPLIPMVIASIVGVLISLISSRFKYSNVISTVAMLMVFLVFLFGTFTIRSDEQLVNLGTIFGDRMKFTYPIAQWFFDGVVRFQLSSFLLFCGGSILAFAVFSIVLGSWFKKFSTYISAIHSGTKYQMKELQQNSVFKALFIKEAKRYFTCSIYVFNTAFGLIIVLIGAIGIHLPKMKEIDMMISEPEIAMIVRSMLPFAIALMTGLCMITASSISLEGKNLWIIKSAPISTFTYLNSKIWLQNSLTMPVSLIASISFGIKFCTSVIQMLILIVLPLAFCYFSSVYGLWINLKFPMLEWKNETTVVKQSAASLIATFSSFFIIGVTILIVFMLPEEYRNLVSCLISVVFLAFGILIHFYIKKHGEEIIGKL